MLGVLLAANTMHHFVDDKTVAPENHHPKTQLRRKTC
jgi:hypothetical protein